MKIYTKILWVIMLSLFVISCEKGGKDVVPEPDLDSDAPDWIGGNVDENDHRNQNDDTQVVKGDDYGDLYILIRNEDGVPLMKSLTVIDEHGEEEIWYPLVMAFDETGEPVTANGDYVALSVNEEGEIDDDTYFPKEVEFGRINLIRSPNSVLDDGLDEAISSLLQGDYITTDASGRLVAVYGQEDWLPGVDEDDDKTIDSPRENMAIYRELMQSALSVTSQLNFLYLQGFTDDDILQLAASAYAAGSDKTGTVTKDEIVYINGFMNAYNSENAIKLVDVYEDCDDSYYKDLLFYDFNNFEYNRKNIYAQEWVKITSLNGDGTYSEDVFSIFDIVPFTTELENDKPIYNLEAFTIACDDAVQVLEFIHESNLVEYLGKHEFKPEL